MNAAATSGPRILLLDLDNCPAHLARVAEQLASFDRVIACYGPVEPKLSLTLARQLATAIHVGHMEFVGMPRGGKNAADFGLAFLAGRLSVEFPPDTEFLIVSHDTGLDHVVDLLQRLPRKARRIDGRQASSLPAPAPEPAPTNGALDALVDEFGAGYLRRQQVPPRRTAALRNAIRAYFQGRGPVDQEAFLQALAARGWVRWDRTGNVTYHVPPPEDTESAAAEPPAAEPPAAEFDSAETIPF